LHQHSGGEEMSAEKELLAYCGLYCGDCLGYSGAIADAAQNFIKVLEKYQFGRTAECVFPDELADYDRFCGMLGFMSGLRCPGICRKGARDQGPSGCEVKDCCKTQGFFACYECSDFETCDKLGSLHKGLHTASCVRNMKAIREMGLEDWLVSGRRFCYWIEVDDGPLR
jgi:hypothetical protein